jgi:glycogen synthase
VFVTIRLGGLGHMSIQLKDWEKNWQLMSSFFGENEFALITKNLKHLKIHNIVYCSFESRFASSGGLAAVTSRVLPSLKALPGVQRVILMTPFYPYIIDESKLQNTGISFEVPFEGNTVNVDILKFCPQENDQTGDCFIEEYYLKAESFFEAHNRLNDPYIYFKGNTTLNNEAIKENALFYCKAIPLAVNAIGLYEDIMFHLQEWQTALISLTSKIAMVEGTLTSCGSTQTMHNPFDSFIPLADLGKIIDGGRFHRYMRHNNGGHTAYQLGLQLVDTPITTVSESFATEFTHDSFQTQHFAPHLQDIFQFNGVYGINNGMFKDFPPEFSFPNIDKVSLQEIKEIKLKQRKKLLQILEDYEPEGRFGILNYKGGPITKLPKDIPILVMSGRLDPIQKGFDILLRAIELFEPDEIKVVMTPMPVRDSDLDYFYKVAYRCKGNITIFPIKMTEGYHQLQTGATFGIFPSIYEPFGAAVEFMTNGTVTIARETGGLKDQVEHDVCGYLFREDEAVYRPQNIKEFTQTAMRVENRQNNPWVKSMVEHLFQTIKKASQLYCNYPDTYYKMVINGLKKAESFNWQNNAEAFLKIYRTVPQGAGTVSEDSGKS